jgi:RND family efflux transporter MFP subunit
VDFSIAIRRLAPIVALGLTACSDSSNEPPQAAWGQSQARTQVLVDSVRFEPAVTSTDAVGTSRARLSTDVYPASSGEVVAVRFEPGQFVAKGAVLAELDSRRERLAVEMAELRLHDSERLYDRYQRSAASGAVDANTLDAAKTAFEIARVELEQARVALADRTVRAPFEGYVGGTDVDIGDRVTPTMLVTTIDDRRELFVLFDVPEAFIGELAVGEQVELESLSRGSVTAVGDVIDIGSRIDPATRTLPARALVANADDVLRPGMSFRVGLSVEGQPYAVVPETAVMWGTDGAYIWRVAEGNAVRTPVQVVQRRNGEVLVDADFEAGAIVIVEGTQSVRGGSPVEYDDAGLRFADDEAGNAGATGAMMSD